MIWFSAASHAGEPFASNTYPSVTITKPPDGRIYTYYPTIRMEAAASDPDGRIVQVQFFATTRYTGRQLVATVTNAPYTNFWTDVEPVSSGYVLTSQATDNCGLITTSAPITIYVIQDIYPPIVALQTPTDGAAYRPPATILLSAIVQTADGSEQPVEFYAGTNFLGSANFVGFMPNPYDLLRWPNGYSLLWTNVPAGQYTITARNMDDGYQEGVSPPVTITVANLLLSNPRLGAARDFTFTATGVVTGAPLVLLGSTNLAQWNALKTNIPLTSPFDFNAGPISNYTQRHFRIRSDQ